MWGRGNHGGMQFSGMMDDTIDKYAVEFAAQWRSQYGNFFDHFGWGPSDFDCLTPKEDNWWSGQTSYNELQAQHDQGVRRRSMPRASRR